MSAILEQIETKIHSSIKTSDGLPIRRISVKDYEKMIDIGIFDSEDRVELLDGVIVEMSPKKTRHANVNDEAAEFLIVTFAGRAVIRNQNPVVLDDFSEPEPDIVIARPPRSNYNQKHPTGADILLVVEISDTTVAKDRRKALNYARAGIAQYLLFNLNTDEIEDYREPSADGYRFKQTHDRAATFNLVAFPEIEVKTDALFPPQSEEEIP